MLSDCNAEKGVTECPPWQRRRAPCVDISDAEPDRFGSLYKMHHTYSAAVEEPCFKMLMDCNIDGDVSDCAAPTRKPVPCSETTSISVQAAAVPAGSKLFKAFHVYQSLPVVSFIPPNSPNFVLKIHSEANIIGQFCRSL